MGWKLGTDCTIKAELEESAELGEKYVDVFPTCEKIWASVSRAVPLMIVPSNNRLTR